MPSSASTSLRLELQATGENLSTWGTKTNTNLDLLEDAIVSETDVTLSGGSTTLTATNYTADEARAFLITTSGTSGTVTIPAVAKPYWVQNNATGTVTISNGSNTVDIATGINALIYTDGTDIVTLADTNVRTPAQITAEIDAAVLVLDNDLQTQITDNQTDLQGQINDLQVGALTTAQATALDTLETVLIDPSPANGDILSHDGTDPEWVTRLSIINTRENRWRFR
jgi:hypothetical protein